MSNIKYQMSNFNKVKLLLERTSGVPMVIFVRKQHKQDLNYFAKVTKEIISTPLSNTFEQ